MMAAAPTAVRVPVAVVVAALAAGVVAAALDFAVLVVLHAAMVATVVVPTSRGVCKGTIVSQL